MPKSLTGSVKFDQLRKRFCARINPTDPETGRERVFRRYAKTKVEANKLLRDLLNRHESMPLALRSSQMSFMTLATEYRKRKLVAARYVGERKIAGRRELTAPESLLKSAEAFFAHRKISTINHALLEDYRLHLASLPVKNAPARARSLATINRALALLKTVLNFAVVNGWLRSNPFSTPGAAKLIDISGETHRDRLPTFGEEIALLAACVGPYAYLRPLIIIAADTGLRRNELLTLEVNDLDFEQQQVKLRAINAKTNKSRTVPMTGRVDAELRAVVDAWVSGPLFGVRDFSRAWSGVKKTTQITDLHFHDLRHSFVSRSILAGVPLTMALQASGHSHQSGEWLRYSNLNAVTLRGLLTPRSDQTGDQVRGFARDVLRGLRDALGYSVIEGLEL